MIHKTDICAFDERTGVIPSAPASRCRPTFPAAQRCCAARTCNATIFGTAGARSPRPRTAHFPFAATDKRQVKRWQSTTTRYGALQDLAARRAPAPPVEVDVDEEGSAESCALPGTDLSTEQLSVRVVPKQRDEFHRSRLVSRRDRVLICRDCARLAPASPVAADDHGIYIR